MCGASVHVCLSSPLALRLVPQPADHCCLRFLTLECVCLLTCLEQAQGLRPSFPPINTQSPNPLHPSTNPPTSACSKKQEEKKEERKSPKILHSNHRSTCSLRPAVSSSLSEKVLMPVTRSIRSESQNVDREKEKLL